MISDKREMALINLEYCKTKRSPPLGPVASPYQARNRWKAKIWPSGERIEKSFENRSFLVGLYGRFSIYLEKMALLRLEGLEGIPLFLGCPQAFTIRMSRVDGVPLDKMEPGNLSEACFLRLKELVRRMHDRGVAHGDLHMRNILIHENKPYIIDFSTAYVQGRLPLLKYRFMELADRRLFRFVKLLDIERIYKIEKRFFGRGNPPRMFYLYRLVKRG